MFMHSRLPIIKKSLYKVPKWLYYTLNDVNKLTSKTKNSANNWSFLTKHQLPYSGTARIHSFTFMPAWGTRRTTQFVSDTEVELGSGNPIPAKWINECLEDWLIEESYTRFCTTWSVKPWWCCIIPIQNQHNEEESSYYFLYFIQCIQLLEFSASL